MYYQGICVPDYFNYLSQCFEGTESAVAFYLVPSGLEQFKLIASPEQPMTINFDRITKSDRYWPLTLTQEQIEANQAVLFPSNLLRDAPFTVGEVEEVFGFTQAMLEQDVRFFPQLVINGYDIHEMITLLDTSADVETVRDTANTLLELYDEEHHDNLLDAGVIPTLVMLLGSVDEVTRQKAALLLSFFSTIEDQEALHEAEGIQSLVGLLTSTNTRTVSIAVEALFQLSQNLNVAFQSAVRESGGIASLCTLLNSKEINEEKKYEVLKILNALLGENEANQDAFVATDGIPSLLPLLFLESENDAVCQTSLHILDFLANKNSLNKDIFRQAGGIGLLLLLLSKSSDEFTSIEAGHTLVSLLRNNAANQNTLREAGGIVILFFLLSTDELRRPVAMKILSAMMEQNLLNQNAVGKSGGIKLLFAILSEPEPELIELAVESLTNLVSGHSGHQEALRAYADSTEEVTPKNAVRLILRASHKRPVAQMMQYGVFQAEQQENTDRDEPAAKASKTASACGSS